MIVDHIEKVYNARQGLDNYRYGKEIWLPVPGQRYQVAKNIGLDGTYPFTGEDYAVAYATTLWADMMHYSFRIAEPFAFMYFRDTTAAIMEEIRSNGLDPSRRIMPRVIGGLVYATGDSPEAQRCKAALDIPDNYQTYLRLHTREEINVLSEMTLFTEYVTKGRSIFTTKKGFMGLAPDCAQKGDTVAILLGGTTPYVLRQKDDDYEF